MRLLHPEMLDNPDLSLNQQVLLLSLGVDWVTYRAVETKKKKAQMRACIKKTISKFRAA